MVYEQAGDLNDYDMFPAGARDCTKFWDEDIGRYRYIGLSYITNKGNVDCSISMRTSDDETGLLWTQPAVSLRRFPKTADGEPECTHFRKIGNRWYLLTSISRQSIHGVGRLAYWIGGEGQTIDEVDWLNAETHYLDGEDLCAAQVEWVDEKLYLFGWMPQNYAAGYWGGFKNLKPEQKEEFARYPFPTEEELRAMSLAGAISGAKGFLFYNYHSIFKTGEEFLPGSGEENWSRVTPVVALLRELERAKDAEHCFVFAHPPLHLFGRHFFYSPEFSPEVAAILKRFPVDVYFCGHTHNQTVSIHSGMLQITGSSVGFPAQKTIPLEELHVLPDEPENHCFWGIAEDSTPAYWTVDVDGEALTLRWHSLKGEAELRVRKRFAPPEIVSVPPFTRECAPLTLADYCRIRCGWINVFTANKGKKGFRLRLNGTDLGAAPESSCYAARRVQLLPPEVLPSIGEENRLEIEFPQSDVFAAGSFSLELLLLDGRTIRSAVAPELFVCGESPDFEYARSRAETVRGGERRTVMLAFLPRNQKDAEGGFPPNARI